MKNSKKAFSMIELVFVIVVIGILAAIAIPKFAASRNDALNIKAKTTVAAIRNAISTERQKRILRGDFTNITSLSNNDDFVFDTFDNTDTRVVEYPIRKCENSDKKGCWVMDNNDFIYHSPNGDDITFILDGNRFVCKVSGKCKRLE
jgi:general secretion pathway protein G